LVHAVARPALVAYVPALQSVHEDWPLDACAFPPGQSVQADVPESDAYWPEGHDVQTEAPWRWRFGSSKHGRREQHGAI